METYRFKRALFGSTGSPFLLGCVFEQHLQTRETKSPETLAAFCSSLYVDGLLNGGHTVDQARELKNSAVEIFSDAKCKWISSVLKLEDSGDQKERNDERI